MNLIRGTLNNPDPRAEARRLCALNQESQRPRFPDAREDRGFLLEAARGAK